MAQTGTALTRADSTAWSIACSREPVIRALATLPKLTPAAIAEACDELSLSRTRIFELVGRYRADPVTSSLLNRSRGVAKGFKRLAPDVDQVIADEIEQFHLSRPKPKLSQLVRRIKFSCLERELPPPSRKTIEARVVAIDRERLVAARDGRKAADDRYRPITGSFTADYPLQVVQMDHTPADIIVVDEHFRRPLGRPTLTLQIDVATRCIPGFYISLESPLRTPAIKGAIHRTVAPD